MELGVCLLNFIKFFLDGVELESTLGRKKKPEGKYANEDKREDENGFLFVMGKMVKAYGGHGHISAIVLFLIRSGLWGQTAKKTFMPPTSVGHADSILAKLNPVQRCSKKVFFEAIRS
jgi:hypothetical protein